MQFDFDSRAITPGLVRRLLRAQFPRWADLPITPAEPQGWDNRTFRLGAELSVRLPSAVGYTPQIAKEQRWLPHLARHLSLPIPTPIALGRPGEGFPWAWSVYGWIPGEAASRARIADLSALATALARFLDELQAVDAADGPAPGPHSAYRGGPLAFYADEARRAIAASADVIDTRAAMRVLDAALASTWTGVPVWFHGDVAIANLLLESGRLSAVIDFGCSGVGDPACDLVIAWTLFAGPSRAAFRHALPLVDEATWARARGWALWKAAITQRPDAEPAKARESRRVIAELLTDVA